MRNTVKNVASDMFAGTDSDYFPIIVDIRISFKADYKKRRAIPKYHKCSQQQQDELNKSLQTTQPENIDNNSITEWIKTTQQNQIGQRKHQPAIHVNFQKTLKSNSTHNAQ